jgi:hypothetical protein
MLCQLVCLDRRYQRMNCFNIREVESLLKSRFFPDLVNSYDYRLLLNNTIINLRFKVNTLSTLDNNLLLFNNYPLDKEVRTKTSSNATAFIAFDSTCTTSSNPFTTPFAPLLPFFNASKCFATMLFLDTQLFAQYFCHPPYKAFDAVRMGLYNILEFAEFLKTYIRTELERQLSTLLHLFNLTQGFSKFPF